MPTGSDVWLFTGCVMDAWMRPTHAAVLRVLTAAGAGVALPGAGAACCGALHSHAGLLGGARRRARRVIASMPGEAPVLVDSAGCGAALKDYGHLLGTPEGLQFAARVLDVSEWLAPRVESLPAARTVASEASRSKTRATCVMSRRRTSTCGLCCARSSTSWSWTTTASVAARVVPTRRSILSWRGAIRDRKVEAIRRTGAVTVASANPGCAMHLAAAGLVVRHPFELIDDALGAPDGR